YQTPSPKCALRFISSSRYARMRKNRVDPGFLIYRCAVNFYARLSIVIEDLESIDPEDEDDATVVVVKDEEFYVSAKYLSLWSHYFRAYFKSDMKEKRDGRYPISDADIFAFDFRELLMVILPTQKPITQRNFFRLLKMAQRFDMPELTRKIELFMIDFERNELNRGKVFRIATDVYPLKLVQSALMHRWADLGLLQKELIQTEEYAKLSPETKIFVNQRFVQASIGSDDFHGFQPPRSAVLGNAPHDEDWFGRRIG
ncbi:hypothetical protein PMAYCL1PPCAC_27090, partial [Pristionchus mayeri]